MRIPHYFSGRNHCVALVFATIAWCTSAAPASVPQSATESAMRQAFDAAWSRSAAGQSLAAREREIEAKRAAGNRLLAADPSLSIGERTDRYQTNRGGRELEVELALPLHPFGARTSTQAVAAGEALLATAELKESKLQLAGAVREAYFASARAQVDLRLAERRVQDLRALAADAARRSRAGELARVDAQRAEAEHIAATIAVAELKAQAEATNASFQRLTGMPFVQLAQERAALSVGSGSSLDSHPELQRGRALVQLAKSRADFSNSVRRDPIELTLSNVRERDDIGAPSKSSVRIGLRIPLGLSARNQPRISEAATQRLEAEAALPLIEERLKQEIALALANVSRWTALVPLAETRAKLAIDNASLIDKSYTLGEADLTTKLRTDAERFEAERQLERVKIEMARAISHLNQVSGVLP